uniref:tyrosine-protein kinase receptor TYRO3 n=1 Tax=Ciona intestinalis TaxID=7719 RepID=UPI00089DB0E0|nr:tyrosine-protein kinase receptor TYRO3 [Ciona intestinalis]|eukprot:XP_002124888.2 tyrosine-protein kinase receptor TYRO3 [Ciona intestinalis]
MGSLMKSCIFCIAFALPLFVEGRLRISRHPSSVSWDINSTGTQLRCVAEGAQPISIRWQKNGRGLSSLNHITQWNTEKNSQTLLSTLQFQSLTRHDAASYTCVATDRLSRTVVSHAASVTILGPPVIIQGPTDIHSTLHNSSINIPCVAEGPPDITSVTWDYTMFANDGTPVHSGEFETNQQYLPKLPAVNIAINHSVTQYDISCTANNSRGSVTSSVATVYVVRVPATPLIMSVILGSSTAEIQWMVDYSDVQVCIVRVIEDRNTLFASTEVPAPYNVFTVRNLDATQQYTARVKCHNYIGYSEWSEPYTFSPATNLIPPQNVSVHFRPNITYVTWRVSPNPVKGQLTGYKLELYDVRSSSKTTHNLTPDNLSAMLYGLSTNMEYGVRICGMAGLKKGPFSNLQTFHVPIFIPPSTPDVFLLQIGINSAVVNISLPSHGSHDITSYTATLTTNSLLNIKTPYTSSRNIIMLSGLMPYTSYNCSVTCISKAGKSNPSKAFTFQTLPEIPTASPSHVSAAVINDTGVNITWNSVDNMVVNNASMYYKVCVLGLSQHKCSNTTQSYIILSSIKPGKSSAFVYACTVSGCGVSSSNSFIITSTTLTSATSSPIANVKDDATIIIIAVVVSLAIIVIILAAAFRHFYRKRLTKQSVTANPNVTYGPVATGNTLRSENAYYTSMSSTGSISIVQQLEELVQDVLIENKRLKLGKILGEGEFGFVYKATISADANSNNNSNQTATVQGHVAVKSIKVTGHTYTEVEGFVKEGLRMKDLDHPNVMALIGIAFTAEDLNKPASPLVVLPYMPNGDLRSYLFSMRTAGLSEKFTVQKLLLFALDVAKGMQYLSNRNFIHRDLAARNCMLDENYKVVVSDFGLSRTVYSESYYRQTHISKMPVKWMALESLADNIFTPLSDVWSFGVTVWEILTMGQSPYPGVGNHEVYQLLRNGTRLNKPEHCPSKVWFSVVFPCWTVQVKDRITFDKLVEVLSEITCNPTEDIETPIVQSASCLSGSEYEEPGGVGEKRQEEELGYITWLTTIYQ